jgi:pentatricopeptide repeat protein
MLLLLSYYKAPLEMIGTLCDEMKMKNIQFDERYYTALILANLLHQKYDDAFELLEEMKNKGLTPSTAHYTLTYHFFFFIRHPKVYHLFNEILAASAFTFEISHS